MLDRITKNPKTTAIAIVILLGLILLIALDKLHFDDVKELIIIIIGGGVAGVYAFKKDKDKTSEP